MTDLRFWIEAIVRWVHVFSAILWIGQTYLFNWMEKSLERGSSNPNVVGNLWMVHGGGFYTVEKQKYPELMPRVLHWFKWEAASTWISGIVLIALTYWTTDILCEPEQNNTLFLGVRVGLIVAIGMLIVGWVIYDVAVQTPLAKNEMAFAVFGFAVFVGLAWWLPRGPLPSWLTSDPNVRGVMSPRAAYLHIGAMTGTIMAANVWMRILPAQRKMLAAAKENKTIDPKIAAQGPTRSRHNSYMVIPLLFLMISNHYPTIYGSDYSWAMFAGALVTGWIAARLFRGPTHKIAEPLKAPTADVTPG